MKSKTNNSSGFVGDKGKNALRSFYFLIKRSYQFINRNNPPQYLNKINLCYGSSFWGS